MLKILKDAFRIVGFVCIFSQAATAQTKPPTSANRSTQVPEKTKKRQSKKTTDQAHELGLEGSILFPPARPAVGIHYSNRFRDLSLFARVQASWVSVAQSFSEAAAQSDYADRLTDATGELGEINLSIPELGYRLKKNFILSLSPIFRFTRCVATYKTKNDNSLTFSSLGFSAGIQPAFALRLGQSGTFEIGTGLQFPLLSVGTAALDYTQNSSSPLADFSEQELDSILASLQPYAKELSEGLTLQLGVRWLWVFN